MKVADSLNFDASSSVVSSKAYGKARSEATDRCSCQSMNKAEPPDGERKPIPDTTLSTQLHRTAEWASRCVLLAAEGQESEAKISLLVVAWVPAAVVLILGSGDPAKKICLLPFISHGRMSISRLFSSPPISTNYSPCLREKRVKSSLTDGFPLTY